MLIYISFQGLHLRHHPKDQFHHQNVDYQLSVVAFFLYFCSELRLPNECEISINRVFMGITADSPHRKSLKLFLLSLGGRMNYVL